MSKFLFTLLIFLTFHYSFGKVIIKNPQFGGAHLVAVNQDAKTVQLLVGDVLDIRVRENPSTGYVWMEVSAGNQSVLTSLQENQYGSKFVIDEHEPGMVGVGGQNHFYFKAIAPGVSTIKLVHKRSWEEYNINEVELVVTVALSS